MPHLMRAYLFWKRRLLRNSLVTGIRDAKDALTLIHTSHLFPKYSPVLAGSTAISSFAALKSLLGTVRPYPGFAS